MNAPEICSKCQTHQCCKNQPMLRKEFARVQQYLSGPVKITDIGNGVITFPYKQCPFLSDTGCVIPHDEKPLVCKMFPFVFQPARHGNVIQLLDIGHCPMWREWGEKKVEAFTFWRSLNAK